MATQSTIWTQLSTPLSPIGSIPFVAADTVSIITDIANFFYTIAGSTLSGSLQASQLTAAGGLRVGYTDTTAVPGAATINKPAGRVKLAAGQSTLIVTSSYCFAASIVRATLETVDGTLKSLVVTPAAGSFTITGNANCTGACVISFVIENVF